MMPAQIAPEKLTVRPARTLLLTELGSVDNLPKPLVPHRRSHKTFSSVQTGTG